MAHPPNIQMIREHLQDLIDRIDNSSLSAEDVESLSMTLAVTKYSKFSEKGDSAERDALKYLALGWFISTCCDGAAKEHSF